MAPAVIRPFEHGDRSEVIEVWRRCDLVRPWNDPDRDIDRKLAVSDDMFFVAVLDGRVIGTVMAGYDGHRGWINYLAVDPTDRVGGVGRALMERAQEALDGVGCAKINLQVRSDHAAAVAFYTALGYVTDDVISMGKRLVDDELT